MKNFYIILLLISTVSFAQVPNNYYDSITTETGFELKTALRDIITAGYIQRTYDQLRDGAGISGSQGYIDTHSDVMTSSGNQYENDGTILDFYSENPNGVDPYNFNHGVDECGNQMAEGDCHNREHLVPQSSFNSALPMQSDIHHVIPTDGRVNNFRGSLPFGNVATPNFTSLNGSLRGSSDMVGYSGTVFEPIDEFKGDIARALLYFATRYENTVDDYTSFDMFNGTEDQVFFPWAITVLLDWHNNVDPVDQRERDRNDAAYNFQGNANPFVDHPEYADMIWNPMTDTEAPSDPTNLTASNPTDNTIDLTWTASTDNVGVVSYDIYVDNVNSFNTNGTSFAVPSLLADTNYCFTVKALDAAGNASGFSNQDCETTTDNGSSGGMVDLFFSEYVEGGSTNKALEIANFTGSSVNLSIYTLKLASNTNSFGTVYNFPSGSIANGDVYVVANSGLDSACQPEQDDVNNSITNFNGNDAIGLFKNDVLIDIIGIEGDGNDFAENVTLVRKPEIEFPTTTFDINEWIAFPNNTCDDLGDHNQTLSITNTSLDTFKIYPNPVTSNRLFVNTSADLDIKIYNLLGKLILKTKLTNTNNTIDVSNFNSGVYLIKINSENKSVTKKLIRH